MKRIPGFLRRHSAVFAQLGLSSQLAIFLTVAIAPIGAIAIAQAMYTARETEKLAVKALIDQTRLAAEEEREAITTAFGVAGGLGFVLPLDPADARTCSSHLGDLVAQDPRYLFAGVLTPEGMMHCASVPLDAPRDFAASTAYKLLREDDRRRALVLAEGAISKLPVVSINHPVFREGELVAFISLSLPISLLSTIAKSTDDGADFRLGLMDYSGDVFVEDATETSEGAWAPAGFSNPVGGNDVFSTRTFEGMSKSGEERTYVVTPIFGSDLYALGGWRSSSVTAGVAQLAVLSVLFPAAMLALALGVAYFAVHRLALRHVFYLARIMRAFEGGRRSVRATGLRGAPVELSALGEAFDRMADTIERDEAELAHAVEEKTTLLKEVYHRVKNNLQLIISIMNMQIRAARTPDEKEVIARLQDRVMGLASIHQRLYQANDLTAVRCDELLGEVAENLVHSTSGADGAIRLTVEADPVVLGPDKAIPLALFATETIMNALKHGAGPADDGWLSLSLKRGEDRCLVLTVANLKTVRPREDDGMNTAIGGQLIRAFNNQLMGQITVEDEGPEYRVTLTFPDETEAAATAAQ